jgi:predicted DNA-binding transcriptional regulator YafY
MRRADRLFQIVQHLRGGRLVTAHTLSERLEVSERTIYRDVADLMASGVPIDGEAGVGYILRSGFDLPPLMFTRDELTALTLGARFVKAWSGATLALAAEEALVKIEAVLPEKEKRVGAETNLFAVGAGLPETVRSVIDRLDIAIRERRRVHVVYEALDGETPSSARSLPLGQGVDARRLVRASHRLSQFPR